MEKNKSNFKKFSIIISLCLIAIFVFIPFLNNINGVSAYSSTTDSLYNFTDKNIDLSQWYKIVMYRDDAVYNPSGTYVWNDGDNLYYSNTSTQLVFDFATSTWSKKTWSGLTSFDGNCIWSDGTNYYYSYLNSQYVLNKSTSTWSKKTWSGLTSFKGSNVWCFDNKIYLSFGTKSTSQYYLNTSSSTWTQITWSGPSNTFKIEGNYFFAWKDKLYYAYGNILYLVNVDDFSMTSQTIKYAEGVTYSGFSGLYIWSDGFNLYYNNDVISLVLDDLTNTWYKKVWKPSSNFFGCTLYYFNGVFYRTDGYMLPIGYYSAGYKKGYNLGYNDGYSAGYEAGVKAGEDSDNNTIYKEGYKNGYNAGVATNSGYNDGYSAGYDIGYNEGLSSGTSTGYNNGYQVGYNNGSTEGYNNGYNEGVNATNQYTFYNLFGAILDAPVSVFKSLFNFNLLGVNLLGLITALFTLAMIILIIKFILGGK